jgi:RNA polymerase sigma factor (TIGR02999 family)
MALTTSANQTGECMKETSADDVTGLLIAWHDGNREAQDRLFDVVYKELHRIAERYLRREHSGHTLQTTALVHEAYFKLIDQTRVKWQNRAHFFGVAAQAMRRILVDHARRHHSDKRAGIKISLDDQLNLTSQRAGELVALDEALTTLAELDPQKSRIVELKFFGGLSIEEIAEVLDIGTATVIRQWRLAKAWLYSEINKQ